MWGFIVEACPVNKTHLRSLEFTLNRVLMKVFRTTSMDVIAECRYWFGLLEMETLIAERKQRFMAKIRSVWQRIMSTVRSCWECVTCGNLDIICFSFSFSLYFLYLLFSCLLPVNLVKKVDYKVEVQAKTILAPVSGPLAYKLLSTPQAATMAVEDAQSLTSMIWHRRSMVIICRRRRGQNLPEMRLHSAHAHGKLCLRRGGIWRSCRQKWRRQRPPVDSCPTVGHVGVFPSSVDQDDLVRGHG